jgi:hypothetical protein
MAKTKHRANYSVGYGCPPKHSQFKKGQSGCPTGRPKKRISSVEEIVTAELNDKVAFSENGTKRRATKFRLMIKHAINQAVAGDFHSFAMVIKLLDRLGKIAVPLPKAPLGEINLENMSDVELSDLYREVVREAK